MFPLQWKMALVIHSTNSKTPEELKYLKPISILSPLSKVLEKIMEELLKTIWISIQ